MFSFDQSIEEVIDFNGNDKIYGRVNSLHLLVFNDKKELVNDFTLYEKMFSNLTKLSKRPGKRIMNKYDVIIFIDETIKISFLFIASSIEYPFFTIGLFNENVFQCLQKNILLSSLDFIVNFAIDWSIFDDYCSRSAFTKSLSKFINHCQSHLLLKRLT